MGEEPNVPSDELVNSVETLVDELDDDLLFSLSLGSKELFHSNLLGWLCEHVSAVADRLVAAWASSGGGSAARSGPLRALREWHYIDLVLTDTASDGGPGRARVVVENKMFSLPDLEQLRRHGAELRHLDGEPRLVLLSLADPGWREDRWDDGVGNVWHYVSYRSLAEVVRRRPTDADLDPFTSATLARWVAMVERIAGLAELVGQPADDEPVALPAGAAASLARIRLDVPFQKLRAHHAASKLRRALIEQHLGDVKVLAGVTRGVALVEAFVPLGDGVELGWQLQGHQWRLALRVDKDHRLHRRGHESHEQRSALARELGWMSFDHESFVDLEVGPREKGGVEQFGKFEPDFTYRYVKVPGISVGETVRIGLTFIHRADDQRTGGPRRDPAAR